MFIVKNLDGTPEECEELSNVILQSFLPTGYNVDWIAECTKDSMPGKDDLKIMHESKIIGFHFFTEGCISNEQENIKDGKVIIKNIKINEDVSEYKNKKGLQGYIMGILPEYVNMGAGSFMIDYEKKTLCKSYDYIWGSHDKSLNNINFWLKSRRLIHEHDSGYCTLMDLK